MGSDTLTAQYTPDSASSAAYNSASGIGTRSAHLFMAAILTIPRASPTRARPWPAGAETPRQPTTGNCTRTTQTRTTTSKTSIPAETERRAIPCNLLRMSRMPEATR
jgi:hypothetical protein